MSFPYCPHCGAKFPGATCSKCGLDVSMPVRESMEILRARRAEATVSDAAAARARRGSSTWNRHRRKHGRR